MRYRNRYNNNNKNTQYNKTMMIISVFPSTYISLRSRQFLTIFISLASFKYRLFIIHESWNRFYEQFQRNNEQFCESTLNRRMKIDYPVAANENYSFKFVLFHCLKCKHSNGLFFPSFYCSTLKC